MKALKLTGVGNSTGVILPKDVLARLRLKKGDLLYLVETPDGYRLTPYDPEVARQLDAAETVMSQERDVLRKLGR